ERGASVDGGIAAADARGLLEPDPTLDLDGSDAATKLAAVCRAVFGERLGAGRALDTIPCEDVRGLDADELRRRVERGLTTRLVARAVRGGELRVAFEELPIGSPLVAPADRVVYTYELPAGMRVHTGLAVGYDLTAAALHEDCAAFAASIAEVWS
ncbi:MAG: hypothetical protein KDE27_14495, partial [Planctomycetes bacterium]|nr:hypothetical protein [Planctomycetota bacterium]